MSESATPEVVDREIVKAAPALIHILATCCAPWTHTLCGRPRRGPQRPPDWDLYGRENCVVCLDLERSTPYCARCGSRVGHR